MKALTHHQVMNMQMKLSMQICIYQSQHQINNSSSEHTHEPENKKKLGIHEQLD